jgi:hypothetical protein
MDTGYRHTTAHDLPIRRIPTHRVTRPHLDHTATTGLDRTQTKALIAAPQADTGPSAVPAPPGSDFCAPPRYWSRRRADQTPATSASANTRRWQVSRTERNDPGRIASQRVARGGAGGWPRGH